MCLHYRPHFTRKDAQRLISKKRSGWGDLGQFKPRSFNSGTISQPLFLTLSECVFL